MFGIEHPFFWCGSPESAQQVIFCQLASFFSPLTVKDNLVNNLFRVSLFLVISSGLLVRNATSQERQDSTNTKVQSSEKLNSKSFSNPYAKTLVIGRDMDVLKKVAEKMSKEGTPATIYQGVSPELRAKLKAVAAKKVDANIKRIERTAAKKGIKVSSERLAKFRQIMIKDYMRKRYEYHNVKALEHAMKLGVKIVDLGYSEAGKTRSSFLSAERKQLLKYRYKHYKTPPKTQWYRRK